MKTKLLCGAMGVTLMAGATAVAGPAGPGYVPDLLPPVSNAGECYARVEIPARYDTVSQTVMTEAPHATTRVTQPKFQARQESVMVKEPSVRFEVRQPSFRTVTEQIVTRPAYDKLSVTPPQFSTVSETLTMSEPKLVWKKGNPGELRRQGYIIHSTADAGRGGQGYTSTTQYGQQGGQHCGPTCEIWCLVEEPGTRQTFSRRVMSNPGGVRRHRVPARTQTISKQVVADPGGVREVPVPGQFQTVTVEDLVAPGGEVTENVPPKYGQVQGRVLIEPERYEWRRVVCKPGTAGVSSSYSQGGYAQGGYSQGITYGAGSSYGSGSGYSSGSYSSGRYSSGGHSSGTAHSGSSHSGGTTGYIEAYPFGSSSSNSPAYGSGSGSINDQLDRKASQRGHSMGGHSSGGYSTYDGMAGGYK